MFNWYVKMRPILSLTGFGGGGTGLALGGGVGPSGFTATGGLTDEFTLNGINYKCHVFMNTPSEDYYDVITSSLVVTSVGTGPQTIDWLVVGGGGGGGTDSPQGRNAGGGGGGGVGLWWNAPAAVGTYPISVGAGGQGGSDGGDAVVTDIPGSELIRAYGGGKGANGTGQSGSGGNAGSSWASNNPNHLGGGPGGNRQGALMPDPNAGKAPMPLNQTDNTQLKWGNEGRPGHADNRPPANRCGGSGAGPYPYGNAYDPKPTDNESGPGCPAPYWTQGGIGVQIGIVPSALPIATGADSVPGPADDGFYYAGGGGSASSARYGGGGPNGSATFQHPYSRWQNGGDPEAATRASGGGGRAEGSSYNGPQRSGGPGIIIARYVA
mgnify:CR=1 FL=1